MTTSENVGFIIIRHVNSEKTNKYWNENYRCVRKFYPKHKIMIIDDNSNYEFVKTEADNVLTNVFLIESEFPGRGELLPYYYLNKYKLFEKAVILHDSMFLQQNIDEYIKGTITVKFMCDFQHHWEKTPDITNEIKYLIEKLNPLYVNELLELYEKKERWCGSFGVMSIITLEYVNILEKTYKLFDLLEYLTTRTYRCCLERVFGLICSHSNSGNKIPTLFGDIHNYLNQYCNWFYDFDQYVNDKNNKNLERFPMIKTHSGR